MNTYGATVCTVTACAGHRDDRLTQTCAECRFEGDSISLDTAELAHRLVYWTGERNAEAVALLDVRAMTTIADYFVICTSTSTVQMRAIVNLLRDEAEKEFGRHGRVEGQPADGWMVVDFNDVLVHLFLPEQRGYYRLEEFWAEAPALVQMV